MNHLFLVHLVEIFENSNLLHGLYQREGQSDNILMLLSVTQSANEQCVATLYIENYTQ